MDPIPTLSQSVPTDMRMQSYSMTIGLLTMLKLDLSQDTLVSGMNWMRSLES